MDESIITIPRTRRNRNSNGLIKAMRIDIPGSLEWWMVVAKHGSRVTFAEYTSPEASDLGFGGHRKSLAHTPSIFHVLLRSR